MSKSRRRVPGPPSAGELAAQAGQVGKQVLGFERELFPGFFSLQEALRGGIEPSIAPLGELPASVEAAFSRRLAAQRSLAGLATSPLGAATTARQLTELSLPFFQAATGAGQRFLSEFKPTAGLTQQFLPLVSQQARQQQAFAQQRAQRRATESGQLGQALGIAGGLAGFAFGAPGLGAAIGGGIGGLVSQRGGGGFAPGVAGGLAGFALPALFTQAQGFLGGLGGGGGGDGLLPPSGQRAPQGTFAFGK